MSGYKFLELETGFGLGPTQTKTILSDIPIL